MYSLVNNHSRDTMKKIAVVLSLLSASGAYADRMNIDLQFDEEGKASPEFSVPYSWNEQLFSSLSYSSTSTTNTGSSATTTSSATTIRQDLIQLGLLGYKKDLGALQIAGYLNYEYLTIDKAEFGYGKIQSGANSDLFVVENNVEITSATPSIAADITYNSSLISLRTGASLSIGSTLDVEQDTGFQYQQSAQTKSKKEGDQAASYNVYIDSLFNVTANFGIGINAEYRVLPLDYTVSILNSDLVSFSEQEVSQEDSTLRYSLLFIFKQSVAGMNPSIGITHQELTSDNGASSETTKADFITLGFDQRF
jgi:hypothetical protein